MRKPSLNVPAETPTRVGGGSFVKRTPSQRLYVPLPKGQKASGVAKNKVFFGLFDYSKSPLFNGSIPGTNQVVTEPTWMFYAKIAGHFLTLPGEKFERRIFIACKRTMNEYFTKVLQFQPLFPDSDCPCCVDHRALWRAYDDAWVFAKGLGGGHPGDRKGMKPDDVKIVQKLNPFLALLDQRIRDLRVVERYQALAYDVDKLEGTRELDEDESGPVYQVYIGPKVVYDELFEKQNAEYYDPAKGRTFTLTKDATKGAMFASYKMSLNDASPFPDDVTAYLNDEANIPQLMVSPWGTEGDFVIPGTAEEMAEAMAIAFPPIDLSNIEQSMANQASGAPKAPQAAVPPAAPSPAPAAPTAPAPPGKKAPAALPTSGGSKSRW